MKSHLFTEREEESKNTQLITGVFGLDFGTTNSVVTVSKPNQLPFVLNSDSGQTTPSCVLFKEDNSIRIGGEAYKKRYLDNCVYSFKKYLGTNRRMYNGLTPKQVSTLFIKEILDQVKKHNPQYQKFNGVLVSVPAYFDINQRTDVKEAIENAGYVVVGINDEPTSAAIVYQQSKRIKGNILVFDLGGGTFDSVLFRVVSGIPDDSRLFYRSFQVDLPHIDNVLEILDVAGDNKLGGDDIDHEAVKLYEKENSLKLSTEEYQKLILVAESCKKMVRDIKLEDGNPDFKYELVKKATEKVIKRCLDITDTMVARTGEQVSSCVLCGGSTKSLLVREILEKRFLINTEINPDLAVGVGNTVKNEISNNKEGYTIISRLAKGIGIIADGRLSYLADKGVVLPFRANFTARNSTPYSNSVKIALHQGDRVLGISNHVLDVILEGITSFDNMGYTQIDIELLIDTDGIISINVSGGGASISAKLLSNDIEDESNKNKKEPEVHPKAVHYYRFKNNESKYNNSKLTELIESYRVSGSANTAKEIMKLLKELSSNAI